jgi:hypothetical protein
MHYAIPCGPNRELYGRPIESALAGEGRTSALAPCWLGLLTNETNRCLSFYPADTADQQSLSCTYETLFSHELQQAIPYTDVINSISQQC